MAEKSYLSYSHYSNIERGEYLPTVTMLKALADNLDLPEEYLLNYDDNDNVLEELLKSFKTNIDTFNLKEAELILKTILDEYPFINSIYQETYFYMLRSYYYYRINDKENSFRLFNNEFLPLIKGLNIEDLPDNIKEVYYYIQAVISYFNKKYNESYLYFLKQLPLLKDNLAKAGVYYNIALQRFRLNDFHKAIPYAERAFDLYNIEQQLDKSADTANLLGSLYIEVKDIQNAEKKLTRAFEMAKNNNSDTLKAKILHNLGLVYKFKGDFEKSLDYLYKSIEIKKDIKLNPFISYLSVIDTYIEQNLYDKAEKIMSEVKEHVEDETDEMHLQVLKAKINLKRENYKIYEILIREAIDYFYKNKLWHFIKDISIELAEYYNEQKKYKLAFRYCRIIYKAQKNLEEGILNANVE